MTLPARLANYLPYLSHSGSRAVGPAGTIIRRLRDIAWNEQITIVWSRTAWRFQGIGGRHLHRRGPTCQPAEIMAADRM